MSASQQNKNQKLWFLIQRITRKVFSEDNKNNAQTLKKDLEENKK